MPNRNEKLVKKFVELGFNKSRLPFIQRALNSSEFDFSRELNYPSQLPQIIASVFDTEEKREFLFQNRRRGFDDEYETARDLRRVSDAFIKNKKNPESFVTNLKFVTDYFFAQHQTNPRLLSRNRLGYLVQAASVVLGETSIFSLFKSDPNHLVRLLDSCISTDDDEADPEATYLIEFLEDSGEKGIPDKHKNAALQTLTTILTDPKISLNVDKLDRLSNDLSNIEYDDDPEISAVICLHKYSKDSWPERLASLDLLNQTLGLGKTTIEEVNDALLQMYANQLAQEDLSNQILARSIDQIARSAAYYQQIINSSSQDREQILTFMHKKLGFKGLHKLKRNLVESSYRSQELLQDQEIARIYEHPVNPINTILSSLHGYEIEYPISGLFRSYDSDLATFFNQIGVGMGDGGDGIVGRNGDIFFNELSPGPFYHHGTGIAVFRRFLHSGLIDPHFHYGQGIHLNTNAMLDRNRAESRFHLGHLRPVVISLLLSMTAFDPRRDTTSANPSQYFDEDNNDNLIRINHLKDDNYGLFDDGEMDNYRDEIVSFDLLDSGLFAIFWQQFVTLSNTAGADLRLKRYGTSSPHRQFFQQLSDNWRQHTGDLSLGMKSLGISSFGRLSNAAYDKVKPLLLEVYPDEDRSANPDEIETIHHVITGDQRWPNIVSFIRELNSRTCGVTQSVFGQFETQMINNLRATIQHGSKATRSAFLNLYNLPAISPLEKTDTIEVLASLYSHRL